MNILTCDVLLAGPLGMRDRAGFETHGIIAGVLFLTAIIGLGERWAPIIAFRHCQSRPSTPNPSSAQAAFFREIFETLSEKSFIALFISTVIFSVALGLNTALAFIMLNYFWVFNRISDIYPDVDSVPVCGGMAFFIAPWATRPLGQAARDDHAWHHFPSRSSRFPCSCDWPG